jgi:NAD(P)-dependent dehydrogenase (short-subunit alcohol dehydrogenase family)
MKNIIVITGASSGFGSLTSHAFARASHTVYAGMTETRGRNAPQVEEANRFSKEHGVDLRTVDSGRDLHHPGETSGADSCRPFHQECVVGLGARVDEGGMIV